MSLDPTQITIDRLYDEVTGMRNDVTGMRADLRELTTTVRAGAEQGRDHETRIRTLEHDSATSAKVEKLEKEHGERITSVERKLWIAGGVIAAVSMSGAGVVSSLLTGR